RSAAVRRSALNRNQNFARILCGFPAVRKVRGKEGTNEHAKAGASREVREGESFASHDSMLGETRQRRHDLLVVQSPLRERIVGLEAGEHAEHFGDGGVRSSQAFAMP